MITEKNSDLSETKSFYCAFSFQIFVIKLQKHYFD